MKRLVVVFIALYSFIHPLFAQNGNEWINFSQNYIKIPVGKDGIYRISYSALQSTGLPVNSLDPRKFQLYHRGVEQAILVEGENDGKFDSGDFIDFYGRKNDGTLNKSLYKDQAYQPHNYYNLYSDTTSYFLTIASANGKRISTYQEPNIGLPAETYHLNDKLLLFTNDYAQGKDSGYIIESSFDEGEGWMGSVILHTDGAALYTINDIVKSQSSQQAPSLELVVTGRGPQQHTIQVFVGQSSRLASTFNIIGFGSVKVTQQIQWSDIASNGSLNVSVKVSGVGGGPARASVNYLKLTFAQELDITGNEQYYLNIPANNIGKSFVRIKGATSATRIFDVNDPSNIQLITGQFNTTLDAIVRSTISGRRLLASSTVITPVLKRVSFTPVSPSSFNYLIITNSILRKPAGGYSDPVQAYSDYRASPAGGGYLPKIVNINDLYNQFSYGEQTPVAIFNLMKFLAATRLPDYLFIIGKGLDVYYDYYRKPFIYPIYKDLVPSSGTPGSDVAFTAGLNGTTYNQAVATGRITSTTPQEVAAYLNKVKETEAKPFNSLRRKHVLHLSGGIEVGEPQAFRGYLENFAATARSFYLGGKVSAFAKQSTDIKLINISDEVNAGVNLVTFFGHSSPSTLDFDVGFVSDPVMGYNNKGNYPVLLMNGCDAGAFFLNMELFGEDWINTADKGAIGFIAHTSYGFVSPLRKYSGLFYQVAYGDSTFISKGVGDIQKEVTRRYLQNAFADALDITQVQQMVLLGDPAVRLFGATRADYAIQDENVSLSSLNEDPVTALSDSFALTFIVRNYGQAKNKPLHVQVVRTLSDRSTVTYDSVYSNPVLYSDTLSFIIRDKNLKSAGNNTFEIRIDALDVVEELREDNNTAYLDYFIPLNGTLNLFPRKFSIVTNINTNLSFQHSDILSGEREFLVELDTTNTFDSPYKHAFTIKSTVLARQAITLLSQDSLTYYWRTKLANPTDNESRDWAVSSFTYIADGPEGWTQMHFPQFLDNSTTGLVRDPILRTLRFEETLTSLSLKTFGSGSSTSPTAVSIKINNAEYNLQQQGFGCRTNTINLIAFNRNSAVPYIGIPFTWYNRAGRTCGREPWVINSFDVTQLAMGSGDLIEYIDNIQLGDSVVLFTIGNADFAHWPIQAITKLQEVGIAASQIQSLKPGEPVVIFGRKGIAAGKAKINVAGGLTPDKATLEVQKTITGRFSSGEMRSVLVGPAQRWKAMYVKTSAKENVDQVTVEVFGVKVDGAEDFLTTYVNGVLDLATINAQAYPTLRLVYKVADDVNLTPSKLNNWIVTYDPVGEGLIFYKGNREQIALSEGEVWTGKYGYVNVGDKVFPNAISVSTKVFNYKTLTSSSYTSSIQPPAPGDTTLFSVAVNTSGNKGVNDVSVFVNPYIFPEQYYENNIFTLNKFLNVTDETYSPVLDVTVDGRYLEKDEFISPSPKINIALWDENRTLLKRDTSGINVFLAYPCETGDCAYTRISFQRADVSWAPATDSSDFNILFTPFDLPDGHYKMRIEAKDQSGNIAGKEPYEITFNVKSEVTVSLLDPYPNPVSSETYFKYIYTGNSAPDNVAIQIFDLNGKPVQTIDHRSSYIGSNIITWSPAEADADLPNGIYIYRIILQAQGKIYEKRGKLSLIIH
ncbi:C25 family cysteine peptidase [Chryseosolibacter indicus]|uniref:T9SS type A sorting domain-containing protein n=1 Tax=Chryseosolibacter indicus TaxID=2782351 RepID=A0ABS5VMX1_9BACT|nr:C25 family cysteine peptidase [Chryseosolibacter indicus]MBT1702368.1 T9SS type A sorting domain-containing protein [Chryseosolibacter indicus]